MEVSRELRRLRPVLQAALPCPEIWQQLAEGTDLSPEQGLELEQLADRRALSDATEPRISRPTAGGRRKEHYSGKKKLHAQDSARDGRRASYSGDQRRRARQDAR